MRETVRDINRLKHILKAIANIEEFTQGLSLEIFSENKITFYATTYNIMIIGEAANMITKEFREKHAETQWRSIIDMRNFIAHGYYNVSKRVVWQVVKGDLPVLKKQIERYIEELKEE